jgi:FAD/FMN-containing dehydrogenase
MGLHGLSCDNLVSADVVTADGRFLTASEDENADLFWALRGGGGNYGVVTSFEFRLHPVGPTVLGGMVLHPLADAKDVLQFYRDFVRQLPDEGEAWAALLCAPDGSPLVAMALAYNGSIDEGRRVLAPARTFGSPIADFVQEIPYVRRQTLLDAAFAAPGIHRYWKSGLSDQLSDELIDAAVDGAARFASPMSAVIFLYIHGAAARVSPTETAASALRCTQWDVSTVSQWLDGGESDRHIEWTRQLWSAMERVMTGTAYVNHIAADDSADRVRVSYGPNYDRLVALKNTYDPTNLFRLNSNIRPEIAEV